MRLYFWLLLIGTAPAALMAQQTSGSPAESNEAAAPSPATEGAAAAGAPSSTTQPAGAPAADRTRLNLLGEVNTQQGEGRRNENVRLSLIDNNVLRELNQRMGTTATVVDDFEIDQSYYGAEYGGNPSRPLHLPASGAQAVHGNAYWAHNNSVFNARSFFQVGDVQPSRSNDYGFTVSAPVWQGRAFTINASQVRNRGQVNGNVLVPAADERTPLTDDPFVRPLVERILAAYPLQAPNRTDINPRALNTNASQDINNDRIGGTVDQNIGDSDRFTLRYSLVRQKVDAFQLVGGQNPDTTTSNHQARITWARSISPRTTLDLSLGFDRVGSLLVPEETSLGPWMRIGQELDSIGPAGRFPVDRAQNTFRYAARARHDVGNHSLTFGADLLRRQINGKEVQDHRGRFIFRRDFGRDGVTNLRMGAPSNYAVAIGDVHRGFRTWASQIYLGDEWKASSKLTLSMGLRWEPVTRPSEVDDLTAIPYDSDLNNFAPRFGLAYKLPGRWGVMRAAYGLHYGEIYTATFIQARINTPQVLSVVVQAPYLPDPLRELTAADLDPRARSTRFEISPDLATPYAHVYNYSWEFALPKDAVLELGYVGSRSHKLLAMWYRNRGQRVDGVAHITQTINDRRGDSRYYDIQNVVNGSDSYFDAARVTLRTRQSGGFGLEASYWFSKAIDLGGDYSNTASNANRQLTESPTEFDVHNELRGLSDFDQPHAMLLNLNYQTPQLGRMPQWLQSTVGGWQLSGVFLAKAGQPFTIRSGSDGPGIGNVDGQQNDNPVIVDPSILGVSADDPDTALARLPREAFGFLSPGAVRGNLGRNTFRRDGIFNVNLALSKRWPITGDNALLLRAESLNFTNHPQFAEPGTSLTFANFGQITNTLNDGRTFRFTLRLTF